MTTKNFIYDHLDNNVRHNLEETFDVLMTIFQNKNIQVHFNLAGALSYNRVHF